jgi:O-methyltransferase involved in polyketide biosynthesis
MEASTTEKVYLTKEKQTLLIALYGKAMESRLPGSLLRDSIADRALRQIDFDFSTLKVDRTTCLALAMRAKVLDDWTAAYLKANPGAMVLHLGCGLDTRIFRLNPPRGTLWFDVDYPEVIALRRRLYRRRRKGYRQVGASVTDTAWLKKVPRDRPAMIVAEGLMPYLGIGDAPRLVARLVAHLPRGELAFDGYSRLGVRILRRNPSIRATGATLHWGIDDPRELVEAAPRLRLIEETTVYKPEYLARMALPARAFILLWNLVPALRRVGRLLRYRF